MDKPKESGRQRGVVKDARDLLTQHYTTQAAARQPGGHAEGESPTEYAANKLEGAERDALHTGQQTAGRAVNEYKNRTKAAKERRQQKAESEVQSEGATAPDGKSAPTGEGTPQPEGARDSGANPGAAQAKRKLQAERAAEQRASSPYVPSHTSTSPTGGGKPTGSATGKSSPKSKADVMASAGKNTKGKAGLFKQRTDRVKTPGAVKKTAKKAVPGASAKETFKRSQQIAKAAKAVTKKAGELLMRAAAAVGRAIVSIAAACGPLVVIIVAIAVVGAIIASPFGLFFSGEDEDSKAAMQGAVYEISEEYRENLLGIIAGNSHDELRFTFTNRGYKRADNWIDILAVYAVQTANPDDGMEVVTLDPERIEKLRAVFWDMQEINHEVKNEPKYDAETDTSTDYYVLYITATCKGAWEMADAYGFDRQQRDILDEMLNGAYDSYFDAMIGSAGLFGLVGDGTPVVGNGNFVWPSASSNLVTCPFGPRTHPITGEFDDHFGIDISAGANTGVLAADGGTVTTATEHWSYGNYIVIDHGNGFTTLYAHNNTLLVGVGDPVEQGQQIALVGSTGQSKGNHIHFEVKYNGARVDPLQFFSNYTTTW